MAGQFKALRGRSGRVSVSLSDGEIDVLRGLLRDLLDLIGDDGPADTDSGGGDAAAGDEEADELAAMVDIGTATRRPDDPVLARLFPDGYADDDDAAADFRRYTEGGLRARKRAHASAALASLDDGPGRIVLDHEQALAWLGALNDLRLAIGERIGVGEDLDAELDGLTEDDPRRYVLAVYELLGWLQETLVHALS